MTKREDGERVMVLVEDDEVQYELIEIAAAEAGLNVRLACLRDGQSGFEHLLRWTAPDCPPEEIPALVLLDINLPRMNGLEILEGLRARGRHFSFPIVMLTSSKIPDDLINAFGQGAVSYFVKPLGFGELVRLMDTIGRRWLDVA